MADGTARTEKILLHPVQCITRTELDDYYKMW